MADKDHTQTDAGIKDHTTDFGSCTLTAELNISVEKFTQRVIESSGISRETIDTMSEAVKKSFEAHMLVAEEATRIYNEAVRERSLARMLLPDEATKIHPQVEKTIAELNDTISEMDGGMVEPSYKSTELMKKDREESTKLLNELIPETRDIPQERNRCVVKEKIGSVNQRNIDIDETMKEEDSGTGFDHSSALGKEQDVRSLRNSGDDTEGSRKWQKLGHEQDKLSVLLVEYDTSARIHNKTQIIQFVEKNNLGVKVEVAENGQQAVDFHSRDKASFHLILMDMDMPVEFTSGPEATRSLRALGVKSNIVGFTAKSEKIDRFGLNGCVEKPLTVGKIASFLLPSSQQETTDSPEEDKGLIDP